MTVSLALLVCALGCVSAYDKTFEQETQHLEEEARVEQEAQRAEQEARRAADQAAYDEAARYAAVVYFETGSAVIGETGYKELGWFVKQVAGAPPSTKVLVQGFADSTGGETLNQGLSETRARAVAAHLDNLGIPSSRLVIQGFSENFPAADNAASAGRKNNRRVEVTLR
ncbi:MAG: OmpA family protein [bacterium]|nr:OmpA family protein [bacterium]